MTDIPIHRLGNPSDVVEIRADLIVEVVADHQATGAITEVVDVEKSIRERIEWWLDEGGDE